MNDLLITFEELGSHVMLQGWKQPEIAQGEIWTVCWMHHHFNATPLEPLLNKMSCMRMRIVTMEYPPSREFWLFLLNVLQQFLQYGHILAVFSLICPSFLYTFVCSSPLYGLPMPLLPPFSRGNV